LFKVACTEPSVSRTRNLSVTNKYLASIWTLNVSERFCSNLELNKLAESCTVGHSNFARQCDNRIELRWWSKCSFLAIHFRTSSESIAKIRRRLRKLSYKRLHVLPYVLQCSEQEIQLSLTGRTHAASQDSVSAGYDSINNCSRMTSDHCN